MSNSSRQLARTDYWDRRVRNYYWQTTCQMPNLYYGLIYVFMWERIMIHVLYLPKSFQSWSDCNLHREIFLIQDNIPVRKIVLNPSDTFSWQNEKSNKKSKETEKRNSSSIQTSLSNIFRALLVCERGGCLSQVPLFIEWICKSNRFALYRIDC